MSRGEIEADFPSLVKRLLVVCLQRMPVILDTNDAFFAPDAAQQDFHGKRDRGSQLCLAYIVPNHV